ncbi:hypothetical protein HY086_05385 [Candidatus Gottesmanbacteria bacterium]|nr:hypothetical protein [Candidatus Gottesmanbacteria bacterium]
MPINTFAPSFERSFKKFIKGNAVLKEKVKETLARFAKDPKHPSLRLEKLKGSQMWTIRMDKGIGRHDAYRTAGKI